MKPFYKDELTTIYNCPCVNGKSDILVLDPPYIVNPNDYKYKILYAFTGINNLFYYMMAIFPRTGQPIRWHSYNKRFVNEDYILYVGDRILPELPKFERDETYHKWQRPLGLMCLLLKGLRGDVLDPFMGSGSTLVATKRLGMHSVGYETDGDLCRVAVKRLECE